MCFCKVCKDAGKSESEYTSHWTRESADPSSKVVCPTLLNQNCRFCHELGHTTKYCPKLLEKQKQEKREEKEIRYKVDRFYRFKQEEVEKPQVSSLPKGKFACLETLSSSEDEDENEDDEHHVDDKHEVDNDYEIKKEKSTVVAPIAMDAAVDFPALPTKTEVKIVTPKLNFVAALNRPKPNHEEDFESHFVAMKKAFIHLNEQEKAKQLDALKSFLSLHEKKPEVKLAPWATSASVEKRSAFWNISSDEEDDLSDVEDY
jgi:hypothetical protein